MTQPSGTAALDTPPTPFAPTDADSLRAEITEIALEYAPRRFAVCALDHASYDGAVLAWGLCLPDGRVTVDADEAGLRGSFQSVERALRILGHLTDHPLHTVWIDPEP